MTELHITFEGQRRSFQPGQVARIGRSLDNEVIVSDPAVSRQHAQVTWSGGGWVFENTGRALTFVDGQPVTRMAIGRPVELTLAFSDGPVLRIETAPADAVPAGNRARGRHDHGAGSHGAGSHGAGSHGGTWAGPGPGAGPAREELLTAAQILVPIKSWLTDPGWRQGLRLLVIPYGLLPLVFLALFASSGNLTTPGWAYSLYIAPLWLIAFWLLIRPGPIRMQEAQIGIGIILWVLLWIKLVTININTTLVPHPGRPIPLGTALGIGFNEEITKALPVLLAALLIRKFRSAKLDVRMWMFLGTIAGLVFGVSEQAGYTLRDILSVSQAHANSQAVEAVLAFAERVFVDGFQHAVWTGVAAFFIGMAVNYPRRRVQLIIVGISIPALLHALNDWSLGAFSSPWVWILVQAVSLFLFLGYTISAAAIERRVRQTPLFRGESLLMEVVADTPDRAPGSAR